MATQNYVNQGAMYPDTGEYSPGPMVGGWLFGENLDRRRESLNLAQLASQMDVARQGMELKRRGVENQEFYDGATLRSLEGDLKTETIRGQLPHARSLADMGAKHTLASQEFDMQTRFSPEAMKDFLRGLREKATEEQWKNATREAAAMADIANFALQIQQSNGAMAAMAAMQQRLRMYRRQGINLPTEAVMNPQNWVPLRRHAIDTIQHMQNIEKEALEGAFRLEEADIRGRYGVDAATERGPREGTINQNSEVAMIRREVQNYINNSQPVPPALAQREETALGQVFDRTFQDMYPGDYLESLNPGERGVAAKRRLAQARIEYIQRNALTRRPIAGATTPAAGATTPAAGGGIPTRNVVGGGGNPVTGTTRRDLSQYERKP